MQLKDIKLIEVSTKSTIFEQNSFTSGKGKIKVEYGELNFEVGGVLVQDEKKSTVIVTATPQILGSREGSENLEFSLKISMRMIYIYSRENVMDEKFLADNAWYFSSFLRTYFKIYAEQIFNQSSISGIKLPLN
ncbi:hypothetical protein RBI98_07170 [Citrobacter koseri]|uniref:hypothetical protein n=1 Tax=Citrobacter koseri TaxID=545 RepID=UPI0027C25C90|nr:hypothetical protein [Citrobacter koseri]MDQ2324570.1 hypothetical protein [Citrobacter koseri]WOI92536.1 hypothetical protein R1016_12565 [Citrobacter koseri]WOJ15799.1 hypothetical protein R1018_12540 [Citrobacter koseri]WOJ22184.1 hypothetical protein R1015_01535 [Citrobacter koseri]